MWSPCISIIALIVCLNLTLASVIPNHLSSKDTDLSQTLSSLLPRTTVTHIDHRHQASSIDLFKRDWRNEHRNIFRRVQQYGEGWTAYFNLLDMVQSNIDMAAHQLEQFYTAVLSMVDVNRISRPAQLAWQASFNGVTMVFRSHRPIPWDWIQYYLTDVVR